MADVGEKFDKEAWIEHWLNLPPLPSEPKRAPVVRIGKRAEIPAEVRRAIRKRDGNRCLQCHWAPGFGYWQDDSRHLEIDHITPWSAGGSDDSTNLRTLCNVCNTNRSNFVGDLSWVVRPTPVVIYCVPCHGPADRPNDGGITVFCGNCERRSWTTGAYPPL